VTPDRTALASGLSGLALAAVSALTRALVTASLTDGATRANPRLVPAGQRREARAQAWQRWRQLGRWVRPDQDDTSLVGKSPEGSRQPDGEGRPSGRVVLAHWSTLVI
jgi:hypothetical protein